MDTTHWPVALCPFNHHKFNHHNFNALPALSGTLSLHMSSVGLSAALATEGNCHGGHWHRQTASVRREEPSGPTCR